MSMRKWEGYTLTDFPVPTSGIFNENFQKKKRFNVFFFEFRREAPDFFFEIVDLFFEKSAAKRPNVFFLNFSSKRWLFFWRKIYHILEVQNALKTKENDAGGW